jgi:hypothetical protein
MSSLDQISDLLSEIGAEHDLKDGALVVAVPCEARGVLPVGVSLKGRLAVFQAFLVRAPERGHEDVYARVLAKHLQPSVWRFGIDDTGDIFITGVLPIAQLSPAILDETLAGLSLLVDGTYEGLVRTGFDVPEDVVIVGAPPWEREPSSGQL